MDLIVYEYYQIFMWCLKPRVCLLERCLNNPPMLAALDLGTVRSD